MQENPELEPPGGRVMDGAGAVFLFGSYSYSTVKYAIFTGTYCKIILALNVFLFFKWE